MSETTTPTIAPIQVWRFHEAPKEYQDAFGDMDDVDWLAFVPLYYRDSYDERPSWINCQHFGFCGTESRFLSYGTLYAGYHG